MSILSNNSVVRSNIDILVTRRWNINNVETTK